MIGIVLRSRNGVEQRAKERLHVGARHVRIECGLAVAGDRVDDREIDGGLVGIQVEEQFVDLVDHLGDPGVGPVDLVDDKDDREFECQGLAQHKAGLGQRTFAGIDEQDDGVDHGERPFDLTAEVGVTRRVDDVDLVTAVPDRRVLGEDRDALLAFEVHGVHDPVLQLGSLSEGAGLPQKGIDERRLAMVDVGDHRHVPQVVARDHGGKATETCRPHLVGCTP